MSTPNLKVAHEEPQTLLKEAAACVRRAKGNRDAAANLLESAIRRSVAYREEAVVVAARYLTRLVEHRSRNEVGKVGKLAMPTDDVAWAAVAEKRSRDLFETFLLPSRIQLGNATRKDLKDAINLHLQHEKGNRASRRFYEALLPRLRGTKKVKDVYRVDEVESIRRRTKSCS